MGDAGQKRAEGAQLLALVDDVALTLDLGLSRLLLGQVEDADEEAGRAIIVQRADGQLRRKTVPAAAPKADLMELDLGAASVLDHCLQLVGIEDERIERMAARLVREQSQQRRRGRVGVADDRLRRVDDDDGDRMGLGYGAEPVAGEPRLLLAAAHRGHQAAAVADLEDQEPDQQEADEEAGDDQPGKRRELALEGVQVGDRAAHLEESDMVGDLLDARGGVGQRRADRRIGRVVARRQDAQARLDLGQGPPQLVDGLQRAVDLGQAGMRRAAVEDGDPAP